MGIMTDRPRFTLHDLALFVGDKRRELEGRIAAHTTEARTPRRFVAVMEHELLYWDELEARLPDLCADNAMLPRALT